MLMYIYIYLWEENMHKLVRLVFIISFLFTSLYAQLDTLWTMAVADIYQDGMLNVVDIVGLINIVLNN